MQHAVNATEVLLGCGPCRFHMRLNGYVKLDNRCWSIKFPCSPFSDRQASACAREQNGGPFALGQLSNPEGQRGVGEDTRYDNIFPGQNSHGYDRSSRHLFV
jgi:hypothetical protein